MKNQELTIDNLNQQLFSQITNLNTDMSAEEAVIEIHKAKAIANLSTKITDNWKLKFNMVKMISSGKLNKQDLPEFSVKQINA